MINQTVITIFTILNVWFGDGNGMVSQAQVAQASSDRVQTDRLAAQVLAAETRGTTLLAEKKQLLNRYERQLQEVDRLKRRRASWRRDRLLRKQLADSHRIARKLGGLDKRLRTLQKRIRSLRGKLLASATTELGKSPTRPRRARLIAWRDRARLFLRPRSKRIILPDSTVDPLADPEDLEEQATQLRQTEKRLAREIANLKSRAQRFRRMVRLRRLRARASMLRRIEPNRPRRSTARLSADRNQATGGAGAGLSSEDSSPTPNDDFSDPSAGSNLVVVLANVVNSAALTALRRARTSNDPLFKARAADSARKQVKARLERLRAQRKRIRRRARSLRRRR